MQTVLGSAFTPEIKTAWEEAYQVVADLFITVEAGMYESAEKQPGGWRDWREFIVWKKEKGKQCDYFLLLETKGWKTNRFVLAWPIYQSENTCPRPTVYLRFANTAYPMLREKDIIGSA